MLVRTNELKMPYNKYQARRVVRIVKEIPKERREELAAEIEARASIMGYQNGDALKAALKHLKGGKLNGTPARARDNKPT